MKNYYQILQINQNATVEEIKKSYRELAAILHPDKQTDEKKAKTAAEQFKLINEAHETLSDEKKRLQYDNELNSPKTPNKTRFEIFGLSFSWNELQVAGIVLVMLAFFLGLILANNKRTFLS